MPDDDGDAPGNAVVLAKFMMLGNVINNLRERRYEYADAVEASVLDEWAGRARTIARFFHDRRVSGRRRFRRGHDWF